MAGFLIVPSPGATGQAGQTSIIPAGSRRNKRKPMVSLDINLIRRGRLYVQVVF